jgi:glycosyltransferase involved in cell wall biosynthesis
MSLPATSGRLRILILSEQYPPYHVGGYAIACQRTCDLLLKRGHEIHVLTSICSAVETPCEPNVSRVLSWLPPEGFASPTPWYLLKQLWRAHQLRRNAQIALNQARRFSPDIVFVWQSESIGVGAAVGLKRAGYPVIHRRDDEAMADLIERIDCDRNLIWRKCRQFLYNLKPHELKSADLIVISGALQERHVAAGFDAERIVTIPNGVLKCEIVNAGTNEHLGSIVRLLLAGRVCAAKGVHIAIQAMALIRKNSQLSFHIDIVGWTEEPYLTTIKNLIHSLDLDDAVTFIEPRDSRDMWNFYDQYDALLLPSRNEPFGLVLIEAMARGLPAIAVNRGGPRDIIANGVDGFLVEPDDPDALSKALLSLFTNDHWLNSIRSAAIATIRRKFVLEDSVSRIEERLLERWSEHARNSYGYSGDRLHIQQNANAARRAGEFK